MKKMLFSELDIPLIDKAKTVEWLTSIPEDYWFFDTYRKCFMLPIMTRNGRSTKADMLQHNVKTNIADFSWVHFTPNFIKKYFKKNIFNWTKMKSRIVVIRTMAKKENPVHIDCFPEGFNKKQYKLRIVVQGTSDTLYFKTRSGKTWAPFTEKPFIMDGSWPHGMINSSHLDKYTICFGSPWTYSEHNPNLNTLMFANSEELPKDYRKYFPSMEEEKENSKNVCKSLYTGPV